MTKMKMRISKAKLPFYPPYEVKCGLQNGVLTYIYIYIYSIIGACIEYTSSIQFFLLEFSPIFNMVSEQFSNSG